MVKWFGSDSDGDGNGITTGEKDPEEVTPSRYMGSPYSTKERKIAIFAFNGELLCFIHALLNAQEMKEKGFDVKLILEGAATKLIAQLAEEGSPFNELYTRVKAENLIDCVCRACAAKMGVLESARVQGLHVRGDMSGHPSMAAYLDEGYEILIF